MNEAEEESTSRVEQGLQHLVAAIDSCPSERRMAFAKVIARVLVSRLIRHAAGFEVKG